MMQTAPWDLNLLGCSSRTAVVDKSVHNALRSALFRSRLRDDECRAAGILHCVVKEIGGENLLMFTPIVVVPATYFVGYP